MRTWLALSEEADGDLAAPVHESGSSAGWLCAWDRPHAPHPGAARVDPRMVQADGAACVLSWVWLPAGQRPIADDPAVVHCRRRVLQDGRAAAVSLLADGPSHVAGALTLALADCPDQLLALRDDPFRRLGPVRLLHVGAGLLGPVLRDLGPVVERYAGAPWPYARW